MARKFVLTVVAIFGTTGLSGCIYTVPITADPTRGVEQRLLGTWISKDGKNELKVRGVDDAYYIVSVNGHLFRAYHSDVAKMALGSVQEIETPERKYTYVRWSLSTDGKLLRWQTISRKVIPEDIADSAAVRAVLEKHRDNPALYDGEQEYSRRQ